MKKIFFAVFVLFSFGLFAQQPIVVKESTMQMSRGMQPAFQVDIEVGDLKLTKRNWLKYIGHGNTGKETDINGEILHVEVENFNVFPYPFSIYSTLMQTTEMIRLTVWFTQNDTLFFSSANNADQGMAIEKYLHDFVKTQYQSAVGDELKLQEKKQKDLEDQLASFIKSEEKSWEKIGDAKRSIIKAQDDNMMAENDIRNLNQKISDQNAMVNKTASDANASKGAKKTLKDLKTEKANLQKKIRKNGENVDQWNKEIRAEERNMASMVELQGAKIVEVAAQKEKVELVRIKYNAIQ